MRILFLFLLILVQGLAGIGTVGASQGDVSLLRKAESLTLTSGMALQEHDAIITQAKSKVQLIMKDETIITIGPSSRFEIDSYHFGANSENNLNLKLQHGFFRAITGKIGKMAPERFKIRTRSATIGIRGTDFAAYVDKEKEYIACFNGKIHVLTPKENFDVDASMMIMLSDNKWKKLDLDIQKFHPLLHSPQHLSRADNKQNKLFDSSVLESINQQERLQNSNFNITTGYEITTPPPLFIP